MTGSTNAAEGTYYGARRPQSRSGVSPAIASVLSFIWPGLGNAYAHQPRRAVAYALPPLALVVAVIALVLSNPAAFALNLLSPAFAIAFIGLLAVHGVWRVIAIFDAWRGARQTVPRDSRGSALLAIALSVVVIAAHAAAALYVQSFGAAGEKIFTSDRPTGPSEIDDILGGSGGPIDYEEPIPSGEVEGDTNGDGVVDEKDVDPENGSPGPAFDPGSTAPPYSAPADYGDNPRVPTAGPINVLFIGVDSGLGRDHALTDSLIVASYFPERDAVSMISFPRDTGRFPLFTGGTYNGRINTFLNYARANPGQYPEGPVAALMRQLGFLLGIDIPFYAATNLDGLPPAVDAVGGVDVVLDKAIADSHWNLYLQPGKYHLDGTSVMPYVRSRYGPNNSDWQRARRQQQVIRALAKRATDISVAARLPRVIDAVSEVVRTNVPRENANTLLRIVERANEASTENVVLSPSKYARRIPPEEVNGRYMTELNLAAVRELAIRLFGQYTRYQ